MKRRFSYIILALGMFGYGCSDRIGQPDDARICLSAAVSGQYVDTKVTAVPYNESVPGPDSALEAAVWFTNTDTHTYSVGSGTTYPRQSTIRFTSAGAAFPADALEYPSTDDLIYCVGLYPSSGWFTEYSDTRAYHVIYGNEDLMMAPEISGRLNSHFGTLAFTHQLTWLKIYVNASTQAIDDWGHLTKITVTSPATQLKIDFTTSTASFDETPLVITAFEGDVALTVTDQLRGSVFCAPAASYTMTVETANYNSGNGKAVTLSNIAMKDLNGASVDAAYAKGKMFIITLNLKDIHEIEAAATLGNMDPGSETITLK